MNKTNIKPNYLIALAIVLTSITQEAVAYQACLTNSDCANSTHCCITGKCSLSQLCLNGLKQYGDVCESNYECGSRCCNKELTNQSQYPICRPRMECTRTCQSNSQCPNSSSCCSFGECIHGIICSGNKMIGDMCKDDDECGLRLICKDQRCQEELKSEFD